MVGDVDTGQLRIGVERFLCASAVSWNVIRNVTESIPAERMAR